MSLWKYATVAALGLVALGATMAATPVHAAGTVEQQPRVVAEAYEVGTVATGVQYDGSFSATRNGTGSEEEVGDGIQVPSTAESTADDSAPEAVEIVVGWNTYGRNDDGPYAGVTWEWDKNKNTWEMKYHGLGTENMSQIWEATKGTLPRYVPATETSAGFTISNISYGEFSKNLYVGKIPFGAGYVVSSSLDGVDIRSVNAFTDMIEQKSIYVPTDNGWEELKELPEHRRPIDLIRAILADSNGVFVVDMNNNGVDGNDLFVGRSLWEVTSTYLGETGFEKHKWPTAWRPNVNQGDVVTDAIVDLLDENLRGGEAVQITISTPTEGDTPLLDIMAKPAYFKDGSFKVGDTIIEEIQIYPFSGFSKN